MGPMAQVMVRRMARGCPDLATLVARLGEQVANPAARLAFQQEASTLTTGAGACVVASVRAAVAGPGGARNAAPSAPATASQATPSPAMLDAAQRLLARRVGPIAALLVKRALAAAPQREAFIQRLAAAVDDAAARARLVDALRRLPA